MPPFNFPMADTSIDTTTTTASPMATADPVDWVGVAESGIDDTGPKLWLAGGILGALTAGAILNPATALLVLLLGLWQSFRANEAAADRLEAVINEGLIAPTLKDSKALKQYRLEAGEDTVKAQLEAAIADGLPLSPAATTLARDWGMIAAPTSSSPLANILGGQDIGAVIRPHLDAPVIAIVGPQGAGKSTLCQWLYSQLPGAAIALDPHWALGDHEGIPVAGAGMEYGDIESAIEAIRGEIKARYQARMQGVRTFPKLLVIIEELTNWGAKVPSAGAFIQESLSDFRKANVQLIMVSHGKTNGLMGDAKGTAALREEGMLLIELARKGQGRVTIPGECKGKAVAIPASVGEAQPIDRPPLPFALPDSPALPMATTAIAHHPLPPPPAPPGPPTNGETLQGKIRRHLATSPGGLPQGALIQKIADLKLMGREAAISILEGMVEAGDIVAVATDTTTRYQLPTLDTPPLDTPSHLA